jgi:nucleoside-diphosphate-sugar epimerase
MTESPAVLVTGVTGFIGSAVARRLLDAGARVYGLVRPHSARDRLSGLRGLDILEVESFAVEQLRRVLAGRRIELVCHLAAYGVTPGDDDPEVMLDANVTLVGRLLTSLASHSIRRFIHTGSCSEYGIPTAGRPIAETEPLRPASLYGASKAASVMIGTALAARLGMPFVTLRLFGVFGAGESPHRLVPYLATRLRRGEEVDLTPGEQVRDVLYVDDVAEAFLSAATADILTPYEVYNVCSGCPVRVREIAELVADGLGTARQKLGFGRRPYRPDEPMWMVGDNARFVTATRWRPRTSVEQGIRRYLEGGSEDPGRS